MRRLIFLSFVLGLFVWCGSAGAQTTPMGPGAQLNGFSRALDASANRVFVGEPQNVHTPGRVYVYGKDGGAWTESTYLEADGGTVGDGFGTSLDAMGKHLVVGAPSANAAYLFRNKADGWTQVARLTSPDSTSSFGKSVVLTENRLFVGTGATVSMTEGDTLTSGAVHVFEQQNGQWQEATVLRSEKVGSDAGFASALLASGDHLFVTAPKHKSGAVVVFHAGSEGWTEKQTVTPEGLSKSARFGSSIQKVGESVLVGAPRAYGATGAAYSLSLGMKNDAQKQTWTISGRLLPFDGTSRHLFGVAFAYDGSDLWVGAPGASDQTGVLYRYSRTDSTWSGVEKVSHPKADAGNLFGATLAGSESIVAAGLPGDDHGAGTMGIYSLDAGDWTQTEPIAPTTGDVLSAMTGEEKGCEDGKVAQFSCKKVDLKAFLPIDRIGGERGINLNDIWGWTDPKTGTEYALVGRTDGTAFVDVSDPTNPVYVGELPLTDGARVNSWRDIKVYENHAFVVADNAGDHGMQVFDLTRLRDVKKSEMPVTFERDAFYDKVNSVHNVVINKKSGYAYAVGSSGGGKTCGGGLHMINIQDPMNPTFAGCFADPSTGRSGTGYTHDAQCVMYNGPDSEYQGREICVGSNETAISIADVTNKDSTYAISTGSYPDYGYVHQGWFGPDQRYFYQNDELDEIQGKAKHTRTLVWDLKDLDNPKLANQLMLSPKSTDHNLYVEGTTMYQSNYKSGLRVLDISNPTKPKEVAHFDTQPYGKNSPGFQGTWSNYPFFDNGIVVVSSIGEGLFVLEKPNLKQEL
ncbi:MAG: choice-of-anchor B family protein [Salinibacter sp.]|uniref:choice-of-anchor B family protein n=1 Tax=Salinibacter sp. TaxID=2065818 RepID=UPI0035D4CD61